MFHVTFDFKCNLKEQSPQAQVTAGNEPTQITAAA
jgi:hypothetical protein